MGRVDELLAQSFRHNAWATKELLSFCRKLTRDQLRTTPPGTYGTILEVLNHVVTSEAGYLPRPKITRPAWAGSDDVTDDFDELSARVDENLRLWEIYLADPLPADYKLSLDQGAYEAESFVPIAQALHHGNAHREQVCAIITALGMQPPDLQVWSYAEATGHSREVRAAKS